MSAGVACCVDPSRTMEMLSELLLVHAASDGIYAEREKGIWRKKK